ncbi:MAG TPA: NAD(P)H-binding protein [Polyangia bacterium]|nr:NAD(P)H-binding protein [Polyangia bacterium]
MSKFVVSGVTGHVGSVVARDLLAAGDAVTVIVRDAKKGADWSSRGAQVAVGSVDDVEFLAATVKGADGLFTLIPPHYASGDIYVAQRKSAEALAAAVKKAGVPLVVLLSSVGADRADKNGPIKGLHYAENKLRETGTKLVALRSGSFQENAAGAVAAAKQAGIYPNFLPSADVAAPVVATRDIGHTAAKLLRSPPARSEVVDLVGPAYSSRQLAEKIGKLLGKTLNIVDVPPAGHAAALKQAGVPGDVAEAFAEMYAGFSAGLLVPKGDRTIQATTPIDEVLPALVG